MLDFELGEDVLRRVVSSVGDVVTIAGNAEGMVVVEITSPPQRAKGMICRPASLVPDSAEALCFIAPGEIQSFPGRAFPLEGGESGSC